MPRTFTIRAFLLGAVAISGCTGSVAGDTDRPDPGPDTDKPNTRGNPSVTDDKAPPRNDDTPANQPANPVAKPGGVAGILDCPTTELPPYGSVSAPALSEPFQRNCAACHGGVGQGSAKYPAIPGNLTQAEYLAKVRSGANDMPAFGADFISDAQLAQDFGQLKKAASQPGGLTVAANGPATWSDARVEDLYRKGLAVWRKAGSLDGQACSNCHSSDGVELAIIGFTDDSILRRGQQHLSPEDALTVRDFVHAQRRRLNIGAVCTTDWRPFQPGGTVLPGKNPQEQDSAFVKVLNERNLLLASGKVVTLDDAKKAFAQLQAVDLRALPIGIPLPRWSEDKFNGQEHRDINDYMAPVPSVPNRPSEYFAIDDEYLTNPTDAGLYRLLEENRKNTNDLGYAMKYAVPRVPNSNCHYEDSTSWLMTRIAKPKRLSVLVAAHLFREEIKKPGSFLDRPLSPFPDAPVAANPSFTLGGFAIEPPCYDNKNYPNWIKSFPEGFRSEMPQSDLDRGVVENSTDRITHVWMTLGQVLDPTLISTDDMQSNKLHYWAFRNFTQRDVHLPFMYVHRIAIQARYWSDMRASPLFPKAQGPFNEASRDWLHPLLATENQQSAGLRNAIDPESKTMPSADINRLKGNLIRMMLLLSRDLLQKGMPIQSDQNDDHCLAVTCHTRDFKGYVDELKGHADRSSGRAAFTAQGFDLDLYEAQTRGLITEVLNLMAMAPRR